MIDTDNLDPYIQFIVKYVGMVTFTAIVAYHLAVARPAP